MMDWWNIRYWHTIFVQWLYQGSLCGGQKTSQGLDQAPLEGGGVISDDGCQHRLHCDGIPKIAHVD